MFKRLQDKWGVSRSQFWILFLVFGLTGTTTAALTRYITSWLSMDESSFWLWKVLLRLGMLVFGYQIILLFFGAVLGQWKFFWKYEKKLLTKLKILKAPSPQPILQMAIFASGAGSNAEKIIQYFKNHASIKIRLIVCNKKGAGVLTIAQKHQIPVLMIEKNRFMHGDAYLTELKKQEIDWIVLAGFLWKIPQPMIEGFPQKIMNIHPALLPKFGGKGMYGSHVHKAVIKAGEKESGITIHYVNEAFDEGETIFQAKCAIDETTSPESLAEKIHQLEHRYFSPIIESVLLKKPSHENIEPLPSL